MKNGDTQSRQRQPPGSRESETIRNKRPPGADISFSIPRAPIDETFSVSTPYPIAPPPTPTPPPPLPPPRPLLPRLTLFFSVIYPAAHLSFLNEAGGYSRAHSLLSFVSPFSTSYTPPRAHLHPTSSSFLSLVLPLFTPDAKRKESLREPGNT